ACPSASPQRAVRLRVAGDKVGDASANGDHGALFSVDWQPDNATTISTHEQLRGKLHPPKSGSMARALNFGTTGCPLPEFHGMSDTRPAHARDNNYREQPVNPKDR